ncbi:MAG: serine/threonine-protein kinase [Phycisphaerales bacterium]|nr:serine/threonine-protein kinase [Phycisphaerales bacterium]
MNQTQRERLKEALLVLEGLAPGDRRAWMERRLADDPEVLREAESLLAASRQSDGSLLESMVRAPDPAVEQGVPHRIGPYVVEGLLGQGGMCNVYRASLDAPRRREVALKVLSQRWPASDTLGRFEGEAQVIARLDHPNIARLIDVGTDERGQPFIAMDLVDGPSITEYAKLHQLNLAARLDLFVQACRGVQHAHNRGILHRDIKPSNILVAEEGGSPVAKVIDFGVARLLEPHDPIRRTLHGQIVGTVAYMSPEQADPLMPDADIRSDIYSLGVLLYELIAGRNPIDDATLAGLSSSDIHRLLTHRRLEPPSRAAGVAANDLDCVALKAMEVDPNLRYVSAGALAEDVQRFQRGEPILARPPTRRQLIARVVRRNRALTIVAGAAVLFLVVGVLGLGFGLRRALDERDKAEAANKIAETQRQRAERAAAVFDEVTLTLRRLVLTTRQGINAPYIQVLTRGANDFLASPPKSVPVRARVGFTLGQALNQAADRGLAKTLLTKAIDDLQSSDFDRENAPMRDSMLFTSYAMLAGIERTEGSDERAESMWEKAVELGRTLEGVSPTEMLAAQASFADVLAARGDLERAERILQDARARADAGSEGERFKALLDGTLTGVYTKMNRCDDAVRIGTSAFELRSTGRDNARALSIMIGLKLARALLDCNNPQRAEAVAKTVQEMAVETLGAEHVNTLTATQFLLIAKARLGHPEPDGLRQLQDAARRFAGPDGSVAGRAWRSQLAVVELATALEQTEVAIEAAIRTERDVLAARGEASRDLAAVRWELGRALKPSGQRAAADMLEQAWKTFAVDLGSQSLTCRRIASDLAELYDRIGPPETAERWRRAAQGESLPPSQESPGR